MARYDAGELTAFVTAVFRAAGVSGEDAGLIARSLVDADVHGVATHGTARVAAYVTQLRAGEVNAAPAERVLSDQPAAALVDADRGFGAPAGIRAMDRAIEKARAYGVGLVGVTNVAHFGTAAFYSRHAAAAGCVGLAMTSTSPVVAPYGGTEARIGNSPLSAAAPGPDGEPEIVLDIAQSVSARGRVKLALDAGTEIPAGWAIDADGRPTTDPAAALAGSLLTSGGHKGSGLSVVVEMLAAGLTGAQLSRDVHHSGFTRSDPDTADASADVTVGNLYLAIPTAVFGDEQGVRTRARAIADNVRTCPPAPGFDHVQAPGDQERAHATEATTHGVPLLAPTERDLHDLAERYALAMPKRRTG